tara:strand:+ start:269 stop:532 length:264 start_codon:yes stop_codon:yes gene_type:complete
MKRPNGTATPKEIRIEEALERQTEREKLTPDQQLKVLDGRLGKDTGASKERLRLMRQVIADNQKTRTKGKKNVKDSKTKRRQPDYEY